MDDDFLKDLEENPEKYEKHVEDLANRIENFLKKSAEESAKRFLDKHLL